MKNWLCSLIVILLTVISTHAQLKIGPSIGFYQNYAKLLYPDYTKGSGYELTLPNKSRLFPTIGVKLEMPVSKIIFFSSNLNYNKSNYKIIASAALINEMDFIKNQINTSFSINSVIKKVFSVGIGGNFLHLRNKELLSSSGGLNFNNWGLLLPISYTRKNFVFELSYQKGIKTNYNKAIKEKYPWLLVKPIDAVCFSLTYLFSTNLTFSKKGIDCPRF